MEIFISKNLKIPFTPSITLLQGSPELNLMTSTASTATPPNLFHTKTLEAEFTDVGRRDKDSQSFASFSPSFVDIWAWFSNAWA